MTEENLDLEPGRKLFAGPCDFVLGVHTLDQLPGASLSEIAFAGRSNVGKSSLVNALTGRSTLAKISNTPGRTQQLNFFNLGGKLYLVDMPGYGYAKVSKSQVKQWTQMIREYVRGRPSLRCVLIMVDSRHGLKDVDIELMKLLDEAAVLYRVILTKSDKMKKDDLAKIEAGILEKIKKFSAAFPGVHVTSAEKGYGIEELRAILTSYI